MALINCPECSKDVSDKADACIHCGYPLKKETGLTFEERLEMEKAFVAMESLFDDDDLDDESIIEEEYLCCPKCYSKELTPMKKGFSLGKAAAGVLTLGLYGIVAGSIGSSNINLFCNGCGYKFKSSQAIKLTDSLREYMRKSNK